MPFSGDVFTLPNGGTNASPGQIIQSAVWNSLFGDIQTGFTQVMSQLTSTNSLRNLLFENGSFDVWQRGTGGTASIAVGASTTAYTADRWYLTTGANQASAVSQQVGLTTGSQFCGRVQRNNAQTGVTAMRFAWPFEAYESAVAAGKFVTLQAIIATGANWSPTNGTLTYNLYCGTGAVGKRNATPYTNETTPITGSINLAQGNAGTALVIRSTVIIPANTVQMELQVSWTPVGTAGANDWFAVDDVQLEVNNSPATWTTTSYDRAPFDVCINECYRYYYKSAGYTVAPAAASLPGALSITTAAATKFSTFYELPTRMRIAPATVTCYNPNTGTANQWFDSTTSVNLTAAVVATLTGDCGISITGATASAAEHLCLLHVTADASI